MNRRTFCASAGAAVATLRLDPAPRAALAPTPARYTSRRRRRRPSLGIHIDGVPQLGLDQLGAAEAAVGRVGVVSWYQAWGAGDWAAPHTEWIDAVRRSGRLPLITWEPWAYANPDPAWGPDAIAAGAHDTYLATWARAIAAQTAPVYLRPMHEMNGTWYPWAGGDPATYQAAWRHIVDLFDRAGARAARWVWCPLVDDVGPHPMEAYWPGGRYVDVLALDGYNWGPSQPGFGGWRTPATVFTDAYRRITALDPDHPVWLAEVGCATDGDKPGWITDLYHLVATDMRRTEAVVWFSLDKERNWEVHTDPAVAAAIRNRP